MKTETQITQRNIKKLNQDPSGITQHFIYKCEEHKATCQRFLEFLKPYLDLMHYNFERTKSLGDANAKGIMINKVEDLKQAIKLYEDAGI